MPTVSADDIRFYVNANLVRLERFVERELYFRETAEEITPRLSHQRRSDRRGHRAGTGRWRGEAGAPGAGALAIPSGAPRHGRPLCRRAESRIPVHLEDSARKQNVRASDEPELQFHQPDETLTEENVIADRRAATPEDIASSDEMIALGAACPRGAHRPSDREAFILHAIEGFSVEEIAAITDRKPDEVRRFDCDAREHLRHSAPLAGRWNQSNGSMPRLQEPEVESIQARRRIRDDNARRHP